MDYVVGSVAALISGNVTPNRPKMIRRALTPTKHQPSPNVTPKSEFVEDRSMFLSPTLQKKKAIVKKSPKRIFQNPDLDATEDGEGDSSNLAPKAEKVKKHLKDDLEADTVINSPREKSAGNKVDKSLESLNNNTKIMDNNKIDTPKKKKKKRDVESKVTDNVDVVNGNPVIEHVETPDVTESNIKSPKKKMQRRKSVADPTDNIQDEEIEDSNVSRSPKKVRNEKTTNANLDSQIQQDTESNQKKHKKRNKKNKNKKPVQTEHSEVDKENEDSKINDLVNSPQLEDKQSPVKKKKNRKNKSKQLTKTEDKQTKLHETEKMDIEEEYNQSESDTEEVKSKNLPNPNAITEKDSESEHDSDNEVDSENEETNKKILTHESEKQDESSDEEEKEEVKKDKKEKEVQKREANAEEEIKRTLFVGNVPFSNKCKKEIKKIFNKYGQIETIRIRTIPVKDARVTPKLAVIRNELHPERSTVNVYVKYADASSVNKALKENNKVLNGHHLRVSPSQTSGLEHDPRSAIFVGNLPFAIEDETLRSKFEGCGEITSVRIIRDKKTNAGKGFGYVNFASKDGVELALALSEEDLTIKNRIIRVKRCTQTQNHSQKKAEGPKWKSQGNREQTGAVKRIMNKRKLQESGGDGPPNKRPNINQPNKEKKPRKEFVGMTSEKKKKQKFNKGQKKKKVLSEILTKKRA